VQDILGIIHSIRINPNYTVLIVDDSRVIRSMISKILRPGGYKLLEAISGPEALEILASNQVDLVLLDMEMAEMGGMEVLKNIKKEEQNFHLPVLIISSTSDIETMRNVYKEGALDYFKKPFSPEELKLKVERTIKQKQSESDLQCNIETTDLCNHFISSFYANAVFYANSKLKYADDKFVEYFGENTKNIIQAFKTFDQELIRDIIISMQNSKIFKKHIVDKNNLQYLFKLFPLKNNEFLISIEKLNL
jgi:CheY-like chemotaxis protein